jgi:hypothetical protein
MNTDERRAGDRVSFVDAVEAELRDWDLSLEPAQALRLYPACTAATPS